MGVGRGRLRMKWSYTIETQGIKRLHAHIHACQVVQKNGEAEEDGTLTRRDGRGRALMRGGGGAWRRRKTMHSRVEAEEAAVEGQDVAAERDAVPDAGLQ